MVDAFFGNFDLASLSIWLFWLFFAGLVYYLQRMNMHEGYPLEDDAGNLSPNQGMFPLPSPKTFKLPHGAGELTVPNRLTDPRNADLPLRKAGKPNGFPFVPTGDPMIDGVGPASWCARKDEPELDGRGHPKIQPMAALKTFRVSAGRDPRGLPVVAGDGETVGSIVDMWVDEPEQLVRYLELELDGAHGGGRRLLPMQLARFGWLKKQVNVHSIYGKHFANVPQTKSMTQVTKLEEEKICGYYAGGKLYADPKARLEPQL
ncbi:MAG: photosynthetic reaction center subunit H [Rhodobacteraceae bacterium]|nr:photosynthetic reaction center subunit H [Paracoccaceae bacterium]